MGEEGFFESKRERVSQNYYLEWQITRALLTFSDMILKLDVKTGKGIKVEQQKIKQYAKL